MKHLLNEVVAYIGLALPALVVITNPISAATFFVPFSEGMGKKQQKKVAVKASFTAMWIMIIFAVFGTFIFKLFSITIHAFQIAGGIILFGVAMDMRKNIKKAEMNATHDNEEFSIVPLAIPMIAGPGAITTCLILAGSAKNIVFLGVLVLCVVVASLVVYLALSHSNRLTTVLGVGGVRILVRLMGLILAVIAVQFVLNGVKEAIPIIMPMLK